MTNSCIENTFETWQTQRFDRIFNLVSRVIAHPHTNITDHDKHRALVLISFLSENEQMVEYLYSLLTKEEHKATKLIRKFVVDSTEGGSY